MELTVIIPAYNESANIIPIINDVKEVMGSLGLQQQFEVLVVDDHSSDDTFDKVAGVKDESVRALRLSARNGSHICIRTGLKHAKGKAVVFISADGQDDPRVFRDLIRCWKEGSHIVWALRKKREEDASIKWSAVLFYRLIIKLTGIQNKDFDPSLINFCLMDRKVVDAINTLEEQNTSIIGLLFWMGFKHAHVEYDRKPRMSGESKWSFSRRCAMAKDWLLAFSGFPIWAIFFLGLGIMGVSLAVMVFTYLSNGGVPVLSAVFLLGGLQLAAIGIIGQYIWQTLKESRRRPLAFIERKTEDE